MHSYDYWLIIAFFAVVLVPAPFLGRFYYKVMEGQRTWLTPVFGPVERVCYRLAGVDAQQEQSWQKYALALLAFNLAGFLLLFAILLFQDYLPLNPQQLPGQEWICTPSNCVDCQAVFAGKPAPTFGSWAAREIGAGCQAVTGASSLATGTASHQSCVDTYGHRRQASSHIDSAHCLFASFPTYRRALQPAHFGR